MELLRALSTRPSLPTRSVVCPIRSSTFLRTVPSRAPRSSRRRRRPDSPPEWCALTSSAARSLRSGRFDRKFFRWRPLIGMRFPSVRSAHVDEGSVRSGSPPGDALIAGSAIAGSKRTAGDVEVVAGAGVCGRVGWCGSTRSVSPSIRSRG